MLELIGPTDGISYGKCKFKLYNDIKPRKGMICDSINLKYGLVIAQKKFQTRLSFGVDNLMSPILCLRKIRTTSKSLGKIINDVRRLIYIKSLVC